MDSREPKHRTARVNTDASLLAERDKTDAELIKSQAQRQDDEDRIVAVARERAHETLDVARELADRDRQSDGSTVADEKAVARERVIADAALEQQRDAAEVVLRAEREAHERVLAALLSAERDATDDGLFDERARADEVIATRDDFLGIVSHDLRGILGTISVGAQILANPVRQGEPLDPVRTMGIGKKIQNAAARMNRLVGDLLDVVALEAGTLHLARVQRDATQVIKEAIEAYAPEFVSKEITLRTEIGEAPLLAELDHDRILQVLTNVLSNALKFTNRGGRVTVLLARDGDKLRFTVTDNGVGIPDGHESAVFERFGQVRRDRRGHGLGLYISKCIVEAHGGTIWVARAAEGGTALHFTLPERT